MDNMLTVFWASAFPSVETFVWFFPPCMVFALLQFAVTIQLKVKLGWRCGTSRKAFHFLVFLTAGGLSMWASLPVLCLYGGCVSVLVWWSVFKGDGHSGFEALARLSDAPNRRRYVILPWLSTLMGGLIAQALWGPVASIGYWVVGVGDAIAEPVGLRWGRHRYKMPWNHSWRSFEGSLSIVVVTTLVFLLQGPLEIVWFGLSLLGGLLMALLEGFSPHGADNFILQLAGTGWFVVMLS
jgi:phytol kinase